MKVSQESEKKGHVAFINIISEDDKDYTTKEISDEDLSALKKRGLVPVRSVNRAMATEDRVVIVNGFVALPSDSI